MQKIFTCLSLLALFVLSVAAQTETPTVWDGTTINTDWYTNHEGEEPYKISTAAELAGLAQLVHGGNNFSGKTITLTNDIVLNEKVLNDDGTPNEGPFHEWTAIGTKQNRFAGTFDGGGHTISGLYINKANSYNQGLFGCVWNGGTIQNVGVVDSYVKGNKYVGGVVGYADSSVSGCYNTGTVSGGTYVGGVVGYADSSVSGCYNTGTVSGGTYVGGVVGNASSFSTSSTVSGCYNTGTVSGGIYVGGVVGHVSSSSSTSSTVSGCYNTGEVSGYTKNVGCVIGWVSSSNVSISNCDFLAGVNEDMPGIGHNSGSGISSPLSVSALVEAMNTHLFNDDASGDLWNGEASYDATSRTISLPTFGAAISISLKDLLIFYEVTLSPNLAGGFISANMGEAAEGETVTLTATPDEGYELDEWNVTTDNGTVDVTDSEGIYTFEMPAANVTVTATFTAIDYNITVTQPTEGGIIAVADNKTTAHVGEKITLTATSETGYELEAWNVTYGDENTPVTVTDNTFEMPAANVIVSAVFTAKPQPIPPTGLTATYGQTLADVELPDGWTWDDKTTSVGNVGTRTFTANFAETEEYASATANITIIVEKATPTCTIPTDLTATYGQTLADVELPEGWAWKEAETTSVGEVGEHTFAAIFTPDDTDNYNTVEATVTITVNQATLSDNQMMLEGDEDTIFELGDEGSILTATIIGITDTENEEYWKWKSSNINVATVEMLTPPSITTRAEDDGTIESTAQVTPKGEGSATITVTYTSPNYTGTLTYSIEVKAKEEPDPEPTPDPDPTPQPDPDPIYYNIYLDDVCEGVEASLSRGVVKEGNQVSVYVEVEEGYDAENLKVSFKRSLYGYWEEVEEGVQPGEYIIYNVYADIYIKVEGVEKIEEPTGMEDIEGVKVYAQDGNLYVYTSQPQEVAIITMNGVIVKRERQEGWRSYSLPKGIYIIGIGEDRYKVVVR